VTLLVQAISQTKNLRELVDTVRQLADRNVPATKSRIVPPTLAKALADLENAHSISPSHALLLAHLAINQEPQLLRAFEQRDGGDTLVQRLRALIRDFISSSFLVRAVSVQA